VSDAERKRELKRAYKEQERARAGALMPLEADELESLLDYLDEQGAERRCDESLALTIAWAAENDVEQEPLVAALGEFGGYCDCEVLANVDPDVFRQSFR
jgi:hypothetical protein